MILDGGPGRVRYYPGGSALISPKLKLTGRVVFDNQAAINDFAVAVIIHKFIIRACKLN